MKRTWQLYLWTGRKYKKSETATANGPQEIIKKFGLNDPTNEIVCSRKGYGHYTGRIEVRLPETVATSTNPLPADFLLLATD